MTSSWSCGRGCRALVGATIAALGTVLTLAPTASALEHTLPLAPVVSCDGTCQSAGGDIFNAGRNDGLWRVRNSAISPDLR